MKSSLLILLIFISSLNVTAQFTDRFWAFGDSAAIDFHNLNNPVPAQSVLRARGTCASICDSAGNLLFYAASPHVSVWLTPNTLKWGYVLNKNHQVMENSDSIVASMWYQEMIIIPDPGNYNRFYVFSCGVSLNYGFYYSIVDLNYNNGLGKVIQKNIQLENFQVNDGLAAVKHGNGRDWWLFFKSYNNTTPLDEFYSYLVTPSGVSGPFIQHIGVPIPNGGFLRLKFTKDGTKLYALASGNLFESYDFDRCTGLLSNVNTVHNMSFIAPYMNYWSFALSANASKLYTTSIYNGSNQDTSYLVQYDLNSSNVLGSADTLYAFTNHFIAGLLERGPDDKIYLGGYLEEFDCDFNYLYCDTTRTNEINNLSVINDPNLSGAACNFQPFSFYLGGKRTYLGLPNNPNYELAADSGSICDTVHVGLNELIPSENNLFIFYDAQLKTAFINAQKLNGQHYALKIYDLTGREIISESGKIDSGFYTRNLPFTDFSTGIYIATLTTEKEKLARKFVIK